MRYWVQFLQESSGYIPGTIPPQFGEKKLIDACGDSGVFILDGRNSSETMRQDALKRAQRLQHWRKYPAFRICSGPRLFDEKQSGPIHKITYPVAV